MQVSPELVEITASGAPASKWQQPFDAAMTDVFQVQSDIATKVAQALGVALGARRGEAALREAHAEPRRLRRLPQGRGGVERHGARRDPPSLRKALGFYEQAVALDPELRAGLGESRVRPTRCSTANSTSRRPSSPSALGRPRRRPSRWRQTGRRDTWRSANYQRLVVCDFDARARAVREGAAARARKRGPPARDRRSPSRRLGRWDAAAGAPPAGAAPGSPIVWRLRRLGERCSSSAPLSRGPRGARRAAWPSRPTNLASIENKAMTFLGEGDLAGARAVARGRAEGRRADGARGLRGATTGISSGFSTTSSGSCSCG